jgi:hypothetical protein
VISLSERIERESIWELETPTHLEYLTLTIFNTDDGLNRAGSAFDFSAEVVIFKRNRDMERLSNLLFLSSFVSAAHLLFSHPIFDAFHSGLPTCVLLIAQSL